MTFLNPSAFWAFSLLAIPIIIHLFSFRRYKKVYFSNLAFLQDVKQQKKSSSTLKKLLILAARLLALSFLVLAFSRPVLDQSGLDTRRNSEMIYLDNSFSMQQSDTQGEPLLYRGNDIVSAYLNSLDGLATEVRFLNNDKSYLINSFENESDQVLSEVDFSRGHLGFKGLLDKADLYGSDLIHVYSDFQKSTFRLSEQFDDTSRQFVFHKLTGNQPKNIYVDSVYQQKLSTQGEERVIIVKVKSTAQEVVKDVLVKLQKENVQLAALTLDLSPNGTTEIEFPVGVNDNISGNYEVNIEDSPVVFDNQFYFRVSEANKSKVAILTGAATSSTQAYFEKVFSNEQLFDLNVNSIDNTSFQAVVNSDLLVLIGLQEIPRWLLSQLDQIQGRILLVPEETSTISTYSQLMGVSITANDGSLRESLSTTSLEHPLLQGVFEEMNNRASLPEVTVDYQVGGFYERIFNTNSRRPFLIKSGAKPYYFFTGPLKDSATNFHKHSFFVPVMYKLAQPMTTNPLYYRMSKDVISLVIDSISTSEILELRGADESFVPGYRFESGNKLLLDLPENMNSPGVYQLVVGSDTIRSLAMNYSKDESELLGYSVDEIRDFISGRAHIRLEEINADVRLSQLSIDNSQGTSLWKYALLLTLIFVITESILLRFLK